MLDAGPLCATLLPEVIDLFGENCNLALFGIKERPTLTVAFDILMEKKEQILNVQSAREIFAYMNRLDGLSRPLIERVSKLSFIPMEENNEFLRPSQVFIRSDSSTIVSSRLRHINVAAQLSSSDDNDNENNRSNHRRRKRTGKTVASKTKKSKTVSTYTPIVIDDTDKTGLIDYIDFGPDGNAFLLDIGVLHHPSASVLAELLIDRQAVYFADIDPNDSTALKKKLLAYTSCLRQLAMAVQSTDELQSPALIKRLKTQAWCLGYQTVERRSTIDKQRIFQIVSPSDIYLDDDHQCAVDLRPLLPPEEPDLTKLYEKFGAMWLSECVKRTLVHKGKCQGRSCRFIRCFTHDVTSRKNCHIRSGQ
jgi:hypothetical protein